MNAPTSAESIERLLQDVYAKSMEHDFTSALDVLEVVRSSDPGNIYVAALKRQVQALSSIPEDDEFREVHQRELMEPMLGIIECAIRDHNRLAHMSEPEPLTDSPSKVQSIGQPGSRDSATPGQISPPVSSADAQKELEALKLLYFQRASKFVMKGEYEQALAEVRRVFVVDPDNTIAKQYATRVEVLLNQARRLASVSPDSDEDAPLVSDSPDQRPNPAVNVEEPPHIHTARSTAWDDDFGEAKTVSLIPEHRITPPSHRHTVSYGDSLVSSLQVPSNGAREDSIPNPKRSAKSRALLLFSALGMLLIGGTLFVILSSSSKPSGTREELSEKVSGTIRSAGATQGPASAAPSESPAIEQKLPSVPVFHPAATPSVPTSSAAPKKAVATPDLVKPEPLKEPTNLEVTKAEPQPQRVVPPSVDTKSAVTQSVASAAPAFIPVEKDPQIIRLEKPQFPGFVWKTGIEGQVVVKVLIDPDGKPIDTQILKSTNSVFEQPVIDAVMRSQFSAAQMGQGPVTAWLTIPFKFKQPK